MIHYFEFLRKVKNIPAEETAKSVSTATGKVSPVAGIAGAALPEATDFAGLSAAAAEAVVVPGSVLFVVVCVVLPEAAGVSG